MPNPTALSPDPTRAAVLDQAWANLTTSGPTLNSAERLAVIAAARTAWAIGGDGGDDEVHLATVLEEAAYWLARDAGGLTGDVVADFEQRGLDRFRYLETVGVVARLANVDFYLRGIGADPIPVPEPDGSSPTGQIHPDAAITDGWVPATGPLFATASLDALPDEGAALLSLHQPMYLPMAEIGDAAFHDGLARAQIEWVAARTSFLNECFY